MDPERERQLRRKFGPPAEGRPVASERLPRRHGWRRGDRLLLGLAAVGFVLAAGLSAFAALTPPPAHVAPGCLWWTATPVDRAVAGVRGCFRGYFVSGGGLADSATDPVVVLHMDVAGSACPMAPGDAVVVRGDAAFGDGRITLLVDSCR